MWIVGLVDERVVEILEDTVEDAVEGLIVIMLDRVEVGNSIVDETLVEDSMIKCGMLEDMAVEDGEFEDA